MARVGDLGERLDQRQRRFWDGLRREGDVRVIEGSNDRGHWQCGHGLPDAVKDLDTLMITSGPCPSWYPIMVCRRRSATAHRDFASALCLMLRRSVESAAQVNGVRLNVLATLKYWFVWVIPPLGPTR